MKKSREIIETLGTGLTATMISSRYTFRNGAKIVVKSNSNLGIESNDKFFKLTTYYRVNFMKKIS